MHLKRLIPAALALVVFLTGCGNATTIQESGPEVDETAYVDQQEICEEENIEDEMVALSGLPAIYNTMMPVASGTQVTENERATIDYSNITDGYVMVNFTGSTSKRLKVQVTRDTTYTYDIQPGEWTTFPLSDGNGKYKVTVFENIVDNRYSTVLSTSFNVVLTDEFAPFLRPNQYVNYEDATNTIRKAEELIRGKKGVLQKVEGVYDFVVNHLSYDDAKAAQLATTSGYLPDLDQVLAGDKGICFDYAALMTGMLRSQGVPCKLVVGWAGAVYHAWVSVYSEETGWIDAAVYFNGTSWQRMDPTFISTGKNSTAMQKYVGNGSNYTAKYLY